MNLWEMLKFLSKQRLELKEQKRNAKKNTLEMLNMVNNDDNYLFEYWIKRYPEVLKECDMRIWYTKYLQNELIEYYYKGFDK